MIYTKRGAVLVLIVTIFLVLVHITKKKLCKRDDDVFSVAVAGHFWRIRIRHVLHIFACTVGLFCANKFI